TVEQESTTVVQESTTVVQESTVEQESTTVVQESTTVVQESTVEQESTTVVQEPEVEQESTTEQIVPPVQETTTVVQESTVEQETTTVVQESRAEQESTTEQAGPPLQVPPVHIPPGQRAPGLAPSNDGSRRVSSEDRSGEHEREATGASYATAPETFYQHEGARLGDESDNVSVDTDLLGLPEAPHQREATTNTWYTALSDEWDSRSETSEDSWVVLPPPNVQPPNVQPPNIQPPQLSNTPLPSREAGGPSRIEEPEPAQSLEDSIFSALTQWFPGGGERS
ncbi:hypothetical protein, partial [Kitasatospora purpeofusca]|uniref:hypothetical protein n=1 Tax=Kitasatospora purpeofusca TaxID=67352 RepID=UPI0035DB3A9B